MAALIPLPRQTFTVPLACTHVHCNSQKGTLHLSVEGEAIYRHSCQQGHTQGFNVKHALRAILRRDPLWLKKFLDAEENTA